MEAVYETFKELEIQDKTILTVFNKMDRIKEDAVLVDPKADEVIRISAATGENTDALLELIQDTLMSGQIYVEKVVSYANAGKLQVVRKHGVILKEEYREDGIYVEAYVPVEYVQSI